MPRPKYLKIWDEWWQVTWWGHCTCGRAWGKWRGGLYCTFCCGHMYTVSGPLKNFRPQGKRAA